MEIWINITKNCNKVLIQDNKLLKKEVEPLRVQVASNNQLFYWNTIKISDIPVKGNERLFDIIKVIKETFCINII